MTKHETPAVEAERERREDQDILWNKARKAARDLIDTKGEANWVTATELRDHILNEASVPRYVATAVIYEFRKNGAVIYSPEEGFRAIIKRPEDVHRRNEFLSFVQTITDLQK